MEQEARGELRDLVRSGFYDRDRIMEMFCEERYEPGELDREEVSAAYDAEAAEMEKEKASWPEVTDCDKLDKAFDALNAKGIISLQNAGYTQTDGCDDVRDAYAKVPDKKRIIGYCFYHGQDLERVVRENILPLAFGPVDPKKEQSDGPRVGRVIVHELEAHGFRITWDGTFDQRITIEDVDWKKR